MLDQTTTRSLGLIRRATLLVALIAVAVAVGACGPRAAASGEPIDLSSIEIPTMPPDDFASDAAACIDGSTMDIIDQLRAPGADVPAILAANEQALVDGLAELESSDPKLIEWRDALLSALTTDDMTAAAAQVALLVANEVQVTPC